MLDCSSFTSATIVSALLIAACSSAAEPAQPVAPSPSVHGFVGTWTFEGHSRAPGVTSVVNVEVQWRDDGTRRWFRWRTADRKHQQTVFVQSGQIYQMTDDGQRISFAAVRDCRASSLRRLVDIAHLQAADVRRVGGDLVIETDRSHPRLGDVVDVTRCTSDASSCVGAQRIVVRQFGPGVPSTLEVSPADQAIEWSWPPVESGSFLASTADESCDDTPFADVHVERQQIADSVWSIEVRETDSRMLIVELPTSLIAIEAPVSSQVGDAVITELDRWFPGKPVATLLIGHHHPHYSGAVRSFVARGAQVVATSDAASVVRDLLARRFTMQPDALEKRGPTPAAEITTFVDRTLIGGRVEAIDVGVRSGHTDQYVVFVIDGSILFQGDIGWFVRDGALRAGRGSAALVGVADQLATPPATVLQSWPLDGYPSAVSLAKLRELVIEGNSTK